VRADCFRCYDEMWIVHALTFPWGQAVAEFAFPDLVGYMYLVRCI
jgi:hypothetical protein